MDNKKKKWSSFWGFTFLVLFMAYGAVFVMTNMGYYDYVVTKKKVFTDEQIKQFEEDVKNGINIELNDYLTMDDNFQSKPQGTALKISNTISDTFKRGVTGIFELLNKVIEQ